MERWLSLKVLESPSLSARRVAKAKPYSADPARVYISIPKRTVKLAVTRNRVRRVLREAVRLDAFFLDGKVYLLKVLRLPDSVDFQTAKKALKFLHD